MTAAAAAAGAASLPGAGRPPASGTTAAPATLRYSSLPLALPAAACGLGWDTASSLQVLVAGAALESPPAELLAPGGRLAQLAAVDATLDAPQPGAGQAEERP